MSLTFWNTSTSLLEQFYITTYTINSFYNNDRQNKYFNQKQNNNIWMLTLKGLFTHHFKDVRVMNWDAVILTLGQTKDETEAAYFI